MIDLEFLVRQTCGDASLRSELLALFSGQAEEAARALRHIAGAEPLDVDSATALLHRLKGSAQAIGAWGLAEHLERAELQLAASPLSETIRRDLTAIGQRLEENASHAKSLIAARPGPGLAKRHENG